MFEDETKTSGSQRAIKAPQSVIEVLREHRVWQNKQRLQMGDKWINSNRLFTSWNGQPLNPTALTSQFRQFKLKHNLTDITIHGLRHTNATLQIANGVPLTTVAKRLGHANSATTARIYAHAIRSADEAAAEVLEDLLSPNKNRKTS